MFIFKFFLSPDDCKQHIKSLQAVRVRASRLMNIDVILILLYTAGFSLKCISVVQCHADDVKCTYAAVTMMENILPLPPTSLLSLPLSLSLSPQ